MTEILSVLVAIVLIAILLPLAVRSMRRQRRGSGGAGNALMSLEAIYRPSIEHVIEARRETPKGSAENGEPPV